MEAVYCQGCCRPCSASPNQPGRWGCSEWGQRGPIPGWGAGDCWETQLLGLRGLLLSHPLFSVCFSPEQAVWRHGDHSMQILGFGDSLKPCLDSLEVCPQPVTAWSAGSWVICKELFEKGDSGKHSSEWPKMCCSGFAHSLFCRCQGVGFFIRRQRPPTTPKFCPLSSKSHLEGEY